LLMGRYYLQHVYGQIFALIGDSLIIRVVGQEW
jgi:hypothetical protein